MSHAQVETSSPKVKKNDIKDAPFYAVPMILAIIMLSTGGFMWLLASSIKIFDSMGY
ncbi:hypothetical protein LGT39_10675 [Demequina sp. TTPB684]|uniref:hypothetical protein n=1 Tax=unclassified Demequina TaxID=2620311 RepID=UPI001CF50BD3|nr:MULTISPECIES: hypothetical protein [unclassified Demequina]MCB2413307.1 hypothetical protein [Demequina sp. TTPB684]UPU88973.1 hypothetical protein LGT36_003365 [Demequina sp. TMPB413]